MIASTCVAQVNEFGKVLNVKKVSLGDSQLSQIPQLLDSLGVEFQDVDVANWPEYNKQTPKSQFRIAHTGSEIVINYRSTESSVASTANALGWNVWEDACMEFFCSPNPADGIYYNMECNCTGTVLLCGGAPGTERPAADEATLALIKRWSSLGREPFAERVGECTWQVVLVFPTQVFFKHNIDCLGGKTFRANFYKCGDNLQQPHFLSWNAINNPKPNFHLPKFFGTIVFEP
ncbi:MAG: carbohydrate-binding family 9-like protein [Muribaculaceae bacterium]